MTYTLSAVQRSQTGRRAKQERALSRVPAVIYGQGIETQSISLEKGEFKKTYAKAGTSSLVDVNLNGSVVKAVIKDVQRHPLNLEPIHVDLHQVRMDKEMTAEIPLKFVGEAGAVKVHGGTLVKAMDAVQVRCLPANLPHEIEVDLSVLNTFEDVITIGSLTLSNGVSIEGAADLVIANVAAPLTEEQLKKLEESSVGDVSAVKSEVEEKRAAKEAAAAEAESKS